MSSKPTAEYWLHSAFFTILKNVSSLVLALGGFFFLVRLLDKNTFGVWALFLSTTTLFEFSRNGLVSNAFLKFLAGAREDEYAKIVTASFTVTGILTLIGVIVNCCLAQWLARLWHMPQIAYLFYFYNIIFIITGFINQFNCIQQANLQFKGVFQSSFAGPLLNFIYVAGAYYLHWPVSLFILLYLQLAGAIIAFSIAYVQTRPFIKTTRQLDRRWVRNILNYGKYSFGTTLSAMIFSSIDQWMLGYLLMPAAAAAYNIGVRITNIVEVPTGTVAAIVFPQSAKRSATGGTEAAKYLYEKSVSVILALLAPALLVLYIFSGLVVRLLAGNRYPESIPILHITILYCLFIPFGRQFGTILDSIGKPKTNFYIVMLSALVNVALNYLFINRAGITGAAYGTLGASIFTFVICQVLLKRQLGVNILNVFRYAWSFYPEFLNKHLLPAGKRLFFR